MCIVRIMEGSIVKNVNIQFLRKKKLLTIHSTISTNTVLKVIIYYLQ